MGSSAMVLRTTAVLLRVLSRGFAFASLGLLTVAFVALTSLEAGWGEGESLRRQVEAQLTRRAGPGRGVALGAIDLRFAAKGHVVVVARDIVASGGPEGGVRIGSAALDLRLLPLLAGRAEAQRLVLRDIVLDVAPLLERPKTDPYKALASADLDVVLRAIGAPLFRAEADMRRSGLETVALENIRLVGFDRLALRSRSAVVRRLRLVRDDRFTEGLHLEGLIDLEGSRVRVSADWDQRSDEDGSRSLRVAVSGFDAGELPLVRAASLTPMGVDAPLVLRARAPFSKDGTPQPAFIDLDVGSGRGWFAEREPTTLHSANFRLRLTPQLNSIAILPSSFRTASASGTLSGGAARHERSTGAIAFELVGNGLTSRAGGAEREQRAALHVEGGLDPASRLLRFETIVLRSSGGEVRGAGSMDLTSWTPAMRFDMRAERLTTDAARAFWPPFIAYKQRRFAVGGAFAGGELHGARVTLDAPATVMGRLRNGATLEPGQLSMHLPFRGVSVRTVGDLPRIDEARGILRVEGTSVVASLDGGLARTAEANATDEAVIALREGTLTIDDFLQPGLPSRITFRAGGDAKTLLAVGARRPLAVTQAVGLDPQTATGTADLAIEVATKLKLPPGARPDDWTVRADVVKGGVPSFRGRKVESADLAIVARPGLVRIDGRARIDGVVARLALAEPFGPDRQVGSRAVRLQLDAKARRALGLKVEDYVTGTVEASVTDLGGGRQRVSVDLRSAALAVPFVPWKKGKGVPGRLDFTMASEAGRTRLSGVRLSGKGFAAKGALAFDADGIRSVDLPLIRFNGNDALSLKVRRRKGRYDLDVVGSEFDLRSVMRKLTMDGAAVAKGGPNLRVDARFDRLRGHNKRTMTGATLKLDLRRGAIRSLDFRAVMGRQAPLRFAMEPGGRAAGTTVTLDGHDAGALLAFTDVYTKMRGGRLRLTLNRDRDGIFAGQVFVDRFTVFGEKRLRQLVANHRRRDDENGRPTQRIDPNRADIKRVRAEIRRGPRFLTIRDGQLRGGDMAAVFSGTVYDRRGRIAMKGTFLPAYGLNRALSNIPVLGYAMGNGRKTGLLGITFRLRGMYKNPRLEVNPISLLTPGVFRRIFE